MTLFDIFPFLNGYKTSLGGWGVFFTSLAAILALLGQILTGNVALAQLIQNAVPMWIALVSAFGGLGIVGIGHKLMKLASGKPQM